MQIVSIGIDLEKVENTVMALSALKYGQRGEQGGLLTDDDAQAVGVLATSALYELLPELSPHVRGIDRQGAIVTLEIGSGDAMQAEILRGLVEHLLAIKIEEYLTENTDRQRAQALSEEFRKAVGHLRQLLIGGKCRSIRWTL